jgi:predicted nucleic acid-binding protein
VTLADVNILSTFARMGRLELLRKLFNEQTLYLSPACLDEVRQAVEVGCDFLAPVLTAVDAGEEFDVVPLDRDEVLLMPTLPASFGVGEREAVAVCLHRTGAKFLTNDRRARNFCREKGIDCLDLPTILRALWKRKVCSKKQVRGILAEIETQEGLVFKAKENIFK